MKHLSFLLLLSSMITFALNTNCMLLALRNTKRLQLPQKKRFYSYKTPLEHRINTLENTVQLQGNELAKIKAIVNKWDNNNQMVQTPYVYDPHMDGMIHNSFIDEHNMHYGNTSHED